jgi:hypothetical protein
MFWGKKKEAKPKQAAKAVTTAQASAASAVPAAISLDFTKAADVEAAHDGCEAGRQTPGGYVIGQGQGIRSAASLLVKPGEKFVLEAAVYAETDPTNGEPLVFFTGVLAYDVDGEIIHWWTAKGPIARTEGVRTVMEEFEAPPGVVSARIGICGPWKPEGELSNGKIGVKVAGLKKL